MDGTRVSLYRDLKKLRAHMIGISPEDRREINRLCRDVKLFTKMQMPVMDGLETTRRIRYLEQSEDKGSVYYAHHQLIIGMSANSDHETMEASYFAGMDDFIVKPFHMDVFLQKTKQFLSPTTTVHQSFTGIALNSEYSSA
jgi:CheY-like chemotaxis protein